jgi:hypothetical protein
MHGEKPKAALMRIALGILGPLIPLIMRLSPKYVTTTERVGSAMLIVAKRGAAKKIPKILESADINAIASGV